jgi:hypothetical protein
LIDWASNREVASLELPDDNFNELAFSRDGGQLAACLSSKSIAVWDLRAIRKELKSLGLDWDHPEFVPSPPDAGPLQVFVEAD